MLQTYLWLGSDACVLQCIPDCTAHLLVVELNLIHPLTTVVGHALHALEVCDAMGVHSLQLHARKCIVDDGQVWVYNSMVSDAHRSF